MLNRLHTVAGIAACRMTAFAPSDPEARALQASSGIDSESLPEGTQDRATDRPFAQLLACPQQPSRRPTGGRGPNGSRPRAPGSPALGAGPRTGDEAPSPLFPASNSIAASCSNPALATVSAGRATIPSQAWLPAALRGSRRSGTVTSCSVSPMRIPAHPIPARHDTSSPRSQYPLQGKRRTRTGQVPLVFCVTSKNTLSYSRPQIDAKILFHAF